MARPTYERRREVLGATAEPLWTVDEVALYLGCSIRVVPGLPVPRAHIGGLVRYEPSQVRAWALAQLSHRIPASTPTPLP